MPIDLQSNGVTDLPRVQGSDHEHFVSVITTKANTNNLLVITSKPY